MPIYIYPTGSHYLVNWPKEGSVTTVPFKCIVTLSEAGALEVGTLYRENTRQGT